MDLLPFDTIGGLLAVIIGFGFIIFVHELGHFLVAKYVGVKCPQFAIGMGSAIVSWRKGLGLRRGSSEAEYKTKIEDYLKREADVALQGLGEAKVKEQTTAPVFTTAMRDRAAAALGLSETEYRLNWLPLGGYVKMLGQEDNDPSARSDDPRSFTSKSIGARAAILSAGVIMNIIFGILFFMIAFLNGVGFYAPVVGSISPVGPANEPFAVGHEGDLNYKGLRTGDRILTFNGETMFDMNEVKINTALAAADEKITLGVERTTLGKAEHLTFEIVPYKISAGLLDLGVNVPVLPELPADADPVKLHDALVKSGLTKEEAAGVMPGMRIVEAGGQKIERYHDFDRIVEQGEGKPVEVVFEEIKAKEGQAKRRATIHLTSTASLVPKKLDKDTLIYHLAGLVPAVSIKAVEEKSPADQAGVKSGDLIAKIGDVSWPTTTSVYKVISETKGTPVKLVVQRGNEEKAFEITPRDKRLGIVMGSADPILSQPLPDFPAAKLNLPPGTKVTAINGAKVGSFTEIQQALAAAARHSPGGFEAALECEPNEGKTITPMTVKFAVDKDNAAALAHAGWESPLPTQLFVIEMVILKGETPSQAIGLGIKKTHQSMLQVYLTLLRVIQGSVHPKNFQGPVGIAHTGTIIAKQGFNYLLFFLGLISVNLAVMNFLPIPVVDGGHIVFLVIEKFKGSPVGPKIQNAALIAGLAALVCMFLYVTYNDILRLVFGAA